MRDAVQHTDLARAVVGGCNFCWRTAERAAAVPQAVLSSMGLHPRRLRWGAAGVEESPSVIRNGGGSGGGGGGGGGGLAEAIASLDAARARVVAAKAGVATAKERVGGARATAAAVGGGIVAAVAGV